MDLGYDRSCLRELAPRRRGKIEKGLWAWAKIPGRLEHAAGWATGFYCQQGLRSAHSKSLAWTSERSWRERGAMSACSSRWNSAQGERVLLWDKIPLLNFYWFFTFRTLCSGFFSSLLASLKLGICLRNLFWRLLDGFPHLFQQKMD